MNWQPIKDILPEIDVPVLVSDSRDVASAYRTYGTTMRVGEEIPIFVMHPCIFDSQWGDWFEVRFTPTHWMPLPPPPEDDTK